MSRRRRYLRVNLARPSHLHNQPRRRLRRMPGLPREIGDVKSTICPRPGVKGRARRRNKIGSIPPSSSPGESDLFFPPRSSARARAREDSAALSAPVFSRIRGRQSHGTRLRVRAPIAINPNFCEFHILIRLFCRRSPPVSAVFPAKGLRPFNARQWI